MLLKSVYNYTQLSRKNTDIGRQYICPDGTNVPSVTTILDKTKPDEKKKALTEWRKRVGEQNAASITAAAAGRGTTMHKFLEKYILGEDIAPGSNLVQQQAFKMAEVVIEQMIKPHVNEVWGSEVSLYFPQLYAGTTDLVGLYKGRPSIIDYKQSNKTKKGEWIEDYYLQMTAYALAHNELYDTDIQHGHICMCSTRDLTYQQFDLTPDPDPYFNRSFKDWCNVWWDRTYEYYEKYS